jgi:hypothetical protein
MSSGISRKASAASGPNCVPRSRATSARACSEGREFRYARVEVIAS